MINPELFDEFTLIRQSAVILLFRLFVLDFLSILLYPLMRFLVRLLAVFFGFQAILDQEIWVEIILFGFISTFEMVLMFTITLFWISEYYVVRPQSIIHRKGIFQLYEETYSLKNVETFTVQQSFLGKIFGYGTLKFYSPVLKQEYFLRNIAQPLKLKNLIQSFLLKEEQIKQKEKIIPRNSRPR